jgi:hypothetical protein
MGLFIAGRQILFGAYMGDVFGVIIALLAAFPYALQLAVLARDDAPLPKHFATRSALVMLALFAFGALWIFGQAMGSLAHGPGRHEASPGPYVFFIAGHVALAAWVGAVVKAAAFSSHQVVTRARRSLVILGSIAVVAVTIASLRAFHRPS